jgi:hypothetical protein
MRDAIVTVCSKSYAPLLDLWASCLKEITDLPIFVLTLDGFSPEMPSNIETIPIISAGNPFQDGTPEHACAEKMRLFLHLPSEVERILFIDVDVWVLHPFWLTNGCGFTEDALMMCPDLFVGYKEKMNDEFQPFDESFRMKLNSDGSYFYFNTGVFFATRSRHAIFFEHVLSTWHDYVLKLGRFPSIFDQNIFNYCLIAAGVDVVPMAVTNNCLRQYGAQIQASGALTLEGAPVNAYHFNGGDASIKYSRWIEMYEKLGTLNDD